MGLPTYQSLKRHSKLKALECEFHCCGILSQGKRVLIYHLVFQQNFYFEKLDNMRRLY